MTLNLSWYNLRVAGIVASGHLLSKVGEVPDLYSSRGGDIRGLS